MLSIRSTTSPNVPVFFIVGLPNVTQFMNYYSLCFFLAILSGSRSTCCGLFSRAKSCWSSLLWGHSWFRRLDCILAVGGSHCFLFNPYLHNGRDYLRCSLPRLGPDLSKGTKGTCKSNRSKSPKIPKKLKSHLLSKLLVSKSIECLWLASGPETSWAGCRPKNTFSFISSVRMFIVAFSYLALTFGKWTEFALLNVLKRQ